MKVFKDLSPRIGLFITLAVVITLMCGLIYGAIQQVYRSSANDPQIQISEDMAAFLATGEDVKSVMPPSEVEISKSLVWFLSVYNDKGEVVASNAKLDGQTPVLPQGVLEHAKNNGQNRVTWEPKDGVRIAAVVTSYEGGYVLAGRSLREVDSRIEMLGKMIGGGWALSVVAAFAGYWFLLSKKLH